MTAGPTPLPPRVQAAMAEPILYHRAPAFDALFARVLGRLPMRLPDRQRRPGLRLQRLGRDGVRGREPRAPGHAGAGLRRRQVRRALDRARRGLRRRSRALRARLGRAPGPGGDRPAARRDARTSRSSSPRCRRPRPASSTTSQAIAEVARDHDALLVVDAVSGLGAAELRQDDWGIDVVVTGSQKALMTPARPRASSRRRQRALDVAAAQPGGRYYFDWGTAMTEQRKPAPATPFTPAVSLVARARRRAGDDRGGGHRADARPPRAAGPRHAGRRRRPWDSTSSAIPTSARTSSPRSSCPTTIDGGKVPRLLRDRYGITANGGQAQLKGRILRIAHCGYFGAFDIITSLSGLEMALRRARPRGRARRRRRRRPAGLPRRRRPRRGERVTRPPYRILVKEKIADSGVDAAARALRRRPRRRLVRRGAARSASATTTGSSSARRPSSPPT